MKQWLALLCLTALHAQSSEYFFSLRSGDKLKISLFNEELSLYDAIYIQHNQLIISDGVEINLLSASESCISAGHDSNHIITHLSNALAQWLQEQPSSEESFVVTTNMMTHSWQNGAILPLPPTNGLPIATWSNSLPPSDGATAMVTAATNDGTQCVFANCNECFAKWSQARANHHSNHLKNLRFPCQCPVEGCGKTYDSHKGFLVHIGKHHFQEIDSAQFK